MLCITDDVRQAIHATISSNNVEAGQRRHHRRKRSHSRERHVEVLVAVDVEMRRYHGHNLEHYVLTLMAIVTFYSIFYISFLALTVSVIFTFTLADSELFSGGHRDS